MPATPQEFDGQRVTLMGLGRFGGGMAAARFLAERGAQVLVTDLASPDELQASVDAVADLIETGQITLRLGVHDERDFADTDLVVANPAVPTPWSNRYLGAAEDAGVPITTEITLLLERLRVRPIAVTGTAGKSTTCAMIHHALATDASVPGFLGGNIGGSLLGDVQTMPPDARVVLELSSAQLYWIERTLPVWSPAIAVITGFAPNHLDWHGSLDQYRGAKRHMLTNQRAGDAAVLGPEVTDWSAAPGVHVATPTADDAPRDLLTPGVHNRQNAAVALAACRAAGVDRAADAIRSFPGLPHRCQMIAEHDGIRCYDDSKSTVPDATLLAVRALLERHTPDQIHLIAGGYDKGIDLAPIATLGDTLGSLLLIGSTAESIAARANRALVCHDLDTATDEAFRRAQPGDAVLLSPGCASWDQFADYRARGEAFADACRRAAPREADQ